MMRTLDREHRKYFLLQVTMFKLSVARNSRDVWIEISMKFAVRSNVVW